MNDALAKFLNIIRTDFWDWQFFVFVFFAVLIFCFHVLNREKPFNNRRLPDFIFEKTGKSDRLNCFFILAANVLAIILLVSINGIPVAQTHDEFGYLLAADTFLHHRLANPTPFSPAHFEYFHLLLEPVYAAKFPLLQGFFLAVGKLLTGFPIAGVWLSSLLSALAVYWLLRAVFSMRWALFGTFLWVFAPLNFLWCDSYWGGHIAVIGGALSLGAFFRFLQSGRLKNLLIWGLGIFLLVNSRLYEGTILTGILVLVWIFEIVKGKKIGGILSRDIAVFLLLIFLNLAWIGFYNYSLTQNPLVLPYSLHHEQYHRVPLFIFQKKGEPKPDVPPVIKKLDDRWVAEFDNDYKNASSSALSTIERIPIYLVWLTRSPFLFVLLIFGFAGLAKDKENLFGKKILIILAVFLASLLLTTFKGDRFIAPAVGIAFVSITYGAKMLYCKKSFSKPFVLLLPLIIGGGFILGTFWLEFKRIATPVVEGNFLNRTQINEFLTAKGGKHLIFVETKDAHPADARFYVYNEAEISDSTIIRAHNLSSAENARLIDAYQNRQIWILKNIDNRAVLIEYDGSH